jgi:hypothetical protein
MKELTMEERLAAIQKAITKAECPSDIEQEIVWRLFGTMSGLAKLQDANSEEKNHAEWLTEEIEDILGNRIKHD